MNVWKVIYRIAWVVLTVLILAGVAFVFAPKVESLSRMQDEKTRLQQQTGKLRTDMEELRKKQDRFSSDPNFVERTAKEMGMLRTNEIVFRFDDKTEVPND